MCLVVPTARPLEASVIPPDRPVPLSRPISLSLVDWSNQGPWCCRRGGHGHDHQGMTATDWNDGPVATTLARDAAAEVVAKVSSTMAEVAVASMRDLFLQMKLPPLPGTPFYLLPCCQGEK